MTSKYRKKPDRVECVQWRGNNFQELVDWLGPTKIIGRSESESLAKRAWTQVWCQQSKTWVPLGLDDWIIKGSNGLDVCDNKTFREEYELVLFETIVPTATLTG